MLSLSYCESLGLDCKSFPLMDIQMDVHVVKSCWGMCVMCGVFAGIHLLVCTFHCACACVCVCAYANVFFCICICVPCTVHLRSQQASGPLVNLIEFMEQQALYPILSGNLVIELNYHFDTCRKSTKSPGCSDYFAGTLHVMTSMPECLPKLVHHADRSP